MSKQSEQLKETKELAKKILDLKVKITELDSKDRENLEALNSLLQSSVEKRQETIELYENQLANEKRRLTILGKMSDSDMKRLSTMRLRIKEEEKLMEAQKDHRIKALQEEAELRKAISERLDGERKEKVKDAVKGLQTLKDQGDAVSDIVAKRQDELGVMSASSVVATTIVQTGTLGMLMIANYADTFGAALFGFDIGFKNILSGMAQLAPDIEKSIAGMAKNTGLSLQSIQTSLIAAFDPSGASFAIDGMREQFQALAKEGVDVGSMIERSLSLNEVQGAFTTLIQQSALFRQDFLDGSPATASYIANLVAGLERVGVANADSAEIFDLYNKAMTNSPAESGAALLSLASISKSLGIETSKSFSNFKSVMGPLSQFGSRMTGVFAKLQARAAATGTSLSKLSGIAEGMDTFEGAAKAAQTLNGILGDTFINVTDLALAEPDEKIKMITDAIKDSGVEFDSLNRQYKKIISTAAGFDSVGEFQRQLFNEEEINRSTASLDLKAMSMKKLNSLIVDGLNVTEKQQRAVSAFGAASATSMDVARKGAKEYSEGVGLLMKETAQKTKDPAAAFMSAFMAMNAAAKGEELVGAQTAAKGVTNLAAKAGAAVFIGATAKPLYDKAQNEGIQNALSTGTPMKLGSAGAPQAQATTVERMQLVDIDPEKGMAMIKWAEKIVDKRLERAAAKAREGSP